jgi:pimeloyl-ACP methyl ester carboxylesterase
MLDPDQERAIVDHICQTRSLRSDDYAVRMASIDVPVLFANGSEDRYTPPESVRPFASRIRRAQFTTLPGCGHFLANESRTAADTVCSGIRRWWAGEDLSEELSLPTA